MGMSSSARIMTGPGRWFWFLNLGLLTLYAWTLSERVSRR
jgi:hypothetical protein